MRVIFVGLAALVACASSSSGVTTPDVDAGIDAGPSPPFDASVPAVDAAPEMMVDGGACLPMLPNDALPASIDCIPRDPGEYVCNGQKQDGYLYTCNIGARPKLSGCVDWGVIRLQFLEQDKQWALCPQAVCVRYATFDAMCPKASPAAWACPIATVPTAGGSQGGQWSDGDFYGPIICNGDQG